MPRRWDTHPRRERGPPHGQRPLRHSTIALALDTYTSLLPEADQAAAEAAARAYPLQERKHPSSELTAPRPQRQAPGQSPAGRPSAPCHSFVSQGGEVGALGIVHDDLVQAAGFIGHPAAPSITLNEGVEHYGDDPITFVPYLLLLCGGLVATVGGGEPDWLRQFDLAN